MVVVVVVVASAVVGRRVFHPLLGIAVCLCSRSLRVPILIRMIDFLLLSLVGGVGRLVPLMIIPLLRLLYAAVPKYRSLLLAYHSWQLRFR